MTHDPEIKDFLDDDGLRAHSIQIGDNALCELSWAISNYQAGMPFEHIDVEKVIYRLERNPGTAW